MKNIFKTTILLFALSPLLFSSCEKCKDCTIAFEALNGYPVGDLDAGAQLMGYDDWDAYMASLYPTEELCGDNLKAAEEVDDSYDLDADGTMDYRIYWDCIITSSKLF